MRWYVEVSTIGDSAAPGRLCIEAAQWQAALEAARRLLNDESPLSKFSIEVLDDGYRAVYPALKTRYVIKRAPPNAVLSDQTYVRLSSRPPPPGLVLDEAGPAPASVAPALTVPSDAVPPKLETPMQEPPRARSAPAPQPQQQPSEGPPQPDVVPGPVSSWPSSVLRRRLEEATPESPLVYCEVVYTVEPGLPRRAIERVLLQRFREVCAELEALTSRKYVQLAIFDHEFDQRPLGPPLATLAWKDWRGVPAIGFPAFGEAAPPPSSSMPPRVPGWVEVLSEPPSAPLESRPTSTVPPSSSDSVGVIRSVPVGAPEVPKPPPLPEIESAPVNESAPKVPTPEDG